MQKKNQPQGEAGDSARFLRALYQDDVPQGTFLLVWELKQKLSRWFTSVEQAAEYAASIGKDVYVGCSLSNLSRGPHQRCPAEQSAGITALWVDIDWADPVHKKSESLPPNKDAAIEIAMTCPMKPSIIVDSGHGLQAWWLLSEPWIFKSDSEREEAANLVHGWQRTVQGIAMGKGFSMDSVFDLARVMRIPGSINAKSNIVVPITIHEIDATRRYSPYDLSQFIFNDLLLSDDKNKKSGATKGVLQISADAQPPLDKLELLLENDERCKATYERRRKDLKDQSPSAYDMSLANNAAASGWTDQEIANLLIYARKKNKEDLKLREDYYQRTIEAARSIIQKEIAAQDINSLASTGRQTNTMLLSSVRRKKALDSLSVLFGFRVDRLVKMLADDPVYKIVTEQGEITLGGIDSITSQNKFRNRIAAATNTLIPKRDIWDNIAQVILDACEEVSIGDEATESGAAMAWLKGFIQENPAASERSSAMAMKKPYLDGQELHVFMEPLRGWIRTSPDGGENISRKALGVHLRAAGGQPKVVPYRDTTRNVWVFHAEIAKDIIAASEKNESLYRTKTDSKEIDEKLH
jgi:hypothetical protein